MNCSSLLEEMHAQINSNTGTMLATFQKKHFLCVLSI